MLKALELVGFKSFADKTHFVFPPGVSVVVGPNGSGKSNIVDAIKWVLGAQSVKSLRGKEMADVIFNGSSARAPLNTAEVTVTFDNSSRLLAVDTPEVSITRRVYRSGEGEYLINRQPSRLRDIRDLFAGTGIATEAYSVIEQGKVDVMLQSSPRDRRAIFEEAAGISRFKAKKLEALRRLDRVDQNMLRLSDIVEEVDNRLRTVRMQATKARRFSSYKDRLQELRTQVGLSDWRHLTDQLEELQRSFESVSASRDEAAAKLEAMEAESLALETRISDQDEAIRGCESQIAKNRERIAAGESTIQHERALTRELEEQIRRHRQQIVAVSRRASGLTAERDHTHEAVQHASGQFEAVGRQLTDDEKVLTEMASRLDRLREECEARRADHVGQMRAAAKCASQLTELRSQVTAADDVRQRAERQLAAVKQERQAAAERLDESKRQEGELKNSLNQLSDTLRADQVELDELRREQSRCQTALTDLKTRHTGAGQRAAVLEDLQRRMEGLSSGVKEVLTEAREVRDGPLRQIEGLLADLIHVNVEAAPMVDVALGELAQYLVVAPGREFWDYLQQASGQLTGRVGFLPLDGYLTRTPLPASDLEAMAGVLGRADRFVETTAQLDLLVRRLLGRTYFVKDLRDALALSESSGQGLTFVTPAGEKLAADGTLAVGPRHTATGLISRRSELKALKEEIDRVAGEIARREAALRRLEEQVREKQAIVTELSDEHTRQAALLGEQRLRTSSSEQTISDLDSRHDALDSEIQAAMTQRETATLKLGEANQRHEEIEATLAELESRIESDRRAIDVLSNDHRLRHRVSTERQIALAKSEQQLESLRAQMDQIERSQTEQQQVVSDARSQLQQCLERLKQSEHNALQTASEVAELYLRKESLARDAAELLSQRETYRVKRAEYAADAQKIRQKTRGLERQLHEKELAIGQIDHERMSLSKRLREDYDIDLAEVQHEPTDEELRHREEVEKEIADLRQKISNIGSVNLEALQELYELESRFESLSAQHDDLKKAKASLEQIISKINVDSRRLFHETIEAIRVHFQALFRKLFGGGHADIVVDDQEGIDLLESGIEIVARPPGKEPRSISLLSGGEKTLTCVALLLAIFRSRPSPFCVLDEVDAALDEANIERFISVLTEFLSSTQFVVVTHSKKTMTAANTLYGVTMQESGVSKRVSVRFDDVSDDGEIRSEAAANDDESDGTQAA